MKRFLRQFTLFSASGFVLSLVLHVLGLFNKVPYFGWFAMLLHLGVFVALIGAVVSYFRLRQSEGKDFWKRALGTSPSWMKWMLPIVLIYALVNFFIFWNQLLKSQGKSLHDIAAILYRGFSGHWLFFYWGTFIVFYASFRSTEESAAKQP